MLLFLSTNAQKPINGNIHYQEYYNSVTGAFKSNYSLYFDNTQSIYLFDRDTTLSEIETQSNLANLIQQSPSKPPYYYRKQYSNIIIFNDKTSLRQYTVKDSIKLNWEIHTEKKVLGTYECSKATTEFRGRKYTAWFTTHIPVDYGPRKFTGLPGLILEIYDDNSIYKAFATKIKINEYLNIGTILDNIDISSPILYTTFLDKRCGDALEFKKIIESKMGRGSNRLKLTQVGGNENLEIDTSECIE